MGGPRLCFPKAGLCLARALLAALVVTAPPAFAACKLVKTDEWPVRFQGNLPMLEGSINGKKVNVLLDTGAFASTIITGTAERLDLPMELTGTRAVGVGGEARIYMTRIGELRIGDAVRSNIRVRAMGESSNPGLDFILGDDFLSRADIEFDYAKKVVRIFQPVDCKDAWLAYWDANAQRVPMENQRQIVISIAINGRQTLALLDSGAYSSVVSLPFAATLGIAPGGEGVQESGCSRGVGADLVKAWVARFDSIAIGGETIRDARLRIADFMPSIATGTSLRQEMLLGSDFLRSHRVLVSRTQRYVYFSYTDGVVFPTPAGGKCPETKR
jgi:predicted aspartyl protease